MSSVPFEYRKIIDQIINEDISSIVCDSRKVVKNSVFVAINGSNLNSNKFISDAINHGARYIISDEDINLDGQCKFFRVIDARKFLSYLSSCYYKNKPKNIIAVTGTSGKTSVVNFYQQLTELIGVLSASIGSLGVISKYYNSTDKSNLTTPDPISINESLKNLYDNNIDYVAIEASSHGLDQDRLLGIDIKAAAFTNLSQDHLDYHKDYSDYFSAKKKLFTELHDKTAVLNSDIDEFTELRSISLKNNNKIIDYGYNADFLKIISIEQFNDHQLARIAIDNKIHNFKINILGEWQIYNILCAICLLIATGFDINSIIDVLPKLKYIEGRMQKLINNLGKEIYIDYAHKPDALLKILKNARKMISGNIILIFGCGGDRDRSKRKIMGDIANEFADIVIITDDNPRTEDPNIIRSEIINDHHNMIEIANRKDAIKYGIEITKENDILIIAGKGHEKYQIIGDEKIDFSDYDIAYELTSS